MAATTREVGVRHGGHLHYTSTGIHGACARQDSGNITAHYSAAHTAEKTAIHPDEWAAYSAYSRVQSLANFSRHESVNHSVEFVSASGVHTQNIESYWAQAKLKLKRMKGVAAEKLPSYLDEFMRRKRFAKNTSDAMENIVTHIADIYPVELASLLRYPTLKLHPSF